VKRLAFLALVGLAMAACQSDRIASPSSSNVATVDQPLAASGDGGGAWFLPRPGEEGLRVQTYNVYLGTNLDPLLAATTQQDFLVAAVRAYAELQQTDFPARAGKIADQIAKVRPDVVGLEEVAIWSVSAPFDPTTGQGAPAVVQYDFLKLIIDSLAARHLRYDSASVVRTSDVSAPVPTAFDNLGNPTAFALVRFQDGDGILVRRGVHWRDARNAKYQAYIPLNLLGTQTGLYRGWCSVKVTVDERTFTFVASHLEAEDGGINYLQAQELLGILNKVGDPVIWTGDFNSGPGVTSDFAPTYALVTSAGFTDLWPVAHPNDPGLTNGPLDGVGALDASGTLVPYPSLTFTTRIDLVLLRDRFGRARDVHAAIFGNQPGDRTAAGLWPSDHASVGMAFELAGPREIAHRYRW
jgi:endonuclease/exonuclease/phosphatase family metal-dependent hydrolase